MIIFYDKNNGEIIGTIEGRIHKQEDANLWIGDKEKTERLVIQWVNKGTKMQEIEVKEIVGQKLDENGFYTPIYKIVKKTLPIEDWQPLVSEDMVEIVKQLEKEPIKIYEYKIDIKTKKLIKKIDKQKK